MGKTHITYDCDEDYHRRCRIYYLNTGKKYIKTWSISYPINYKKPVSKTRTDGINESEMTYGII